MVSDFETKKTYHNMFDAHWMSCDIFISLIQIVLEGIKKSAIPPAVAILCVP